MIWVLLATFLFGVMGSAELACAALVVGYLILGVLL